jgi:hypothetical protein
MTLSSTRVVHNQVPELEHQFTMPVLANLAERQSVPNEYNLKNTSNDVQKNPEQ